MVSVCIPIYKPNVKYLTELSESLKRQTIKEFEVVISDDSDSLEVVEKLFLGLNYRYFKNANGKGIFFNLNNAIQQAQFEYIQILCHDDFCEPTLLESQYKALAANPNYLFSYTQSNNIDDNSKVINFNSDKGLLGISKQKLIDYLIVYGCLPGNLSAMMITKKLINKIGLFSTDLPYAADFYYCACAANETGLLINLENLINIRNHQQQASFTLNQSIYQKDIFTIIKLLYKKTNINKWAAFKYINAFYGVMLLKKSKGGRGNKFSNIINSLLKITLNGYPISSAVSLFFLLFSAKKLKVLSSVKKDFIFSQIPKA